MKKVLAILFLAVFLFSLTGFVLAENNTRIRNQTGQDNDYDDNNSILNNRSNDSDDDDDFEDDDNDNDLNESDDDNSNQSREHENERIKERIRNETHEARKEKHKIWALNGTCPEECECAGSTVKCYFEDGSREMTVYAGHSGNIIVQIKGVNATTNVTLYKINNSVYGVFKDNETKRIFTPEQIQERIQEKLEKRLEKFNMTLNEDGTYEFQLKKKSKLFFLFPVKEKVQVEVNAETGEITKTKTVWWGFLSRDSKAQNIVGASCGTVTPGYNDECCQNKGYDIWNNETNECEMLKVSV